MSIKNNFFISKELWNLSSKHVRNRILFSLTLTLFKNSLEILNIILASLFAFLISGKNLSETGKFISFIEFLNISDFSNSSQLRVVSSVFAISLFFWALINVLSSKLTAYSAASITNSLISRLIDNLYKTSNRFFKGIEKEKTITNLTLDANNLTAIVVRPLLEQINSINLIFFVVTFWFFYSPRVALMLFLFTYIFYIIFSKIFTGFLRAKGKHLRKIGDKLTKTIITNYQMFQDYYLNNLIENKKDDLKSFSFQYRFVEADIAYMKSISSVIVQVIFLIFILIYVGFNFSEEGINPNQLALLSGILYTVQRATPSLQKLLRANNSISAGYPSFKKILDNIDFYEKNSSIIDFGIAFNNINKSRDDRFNNLFEVRNLNLKRLLKKNNNVALNFSVNKKGCLGIKGSSGSGKTTILEIISGLFWIPEEIGEILINGQNLYASESQFIRNWMNSLTYLEQKPSLISGNLIANITHLSNEDINYEKLESVLNYSWMKDVLSSLNYKTKYEIEIDDLGTNLSGGQIQRIALARAIYMDKKLLILDEATSALDSKNEDLVLETLKDLADEKSIIIVSHKLKPLELCYEVVTL